MELLRVTMMVVVARVEEERWWVTSRGERGLVNNSHYRMLTFMCPRTFKLGGIDQHGIVMMLMVVMAAGDWGPGRASFMAAPYITAIPVLASPALLLLVVSWCREVEVDGVGMPGGGVSGAITYEGEGHVQHTHRLPPLVKHFHGLVTVTPAAQSCHRALSYEQDDAPWTQSFQCRRGRWDAAALGDGKQPFPATQKAWPLMPSHCLRTSRVWGFQKSANEIQVEAWTRACRFVLVV